MIFIQVCVTKPYLCLCPNINVSRDHISILTSAPLTLDRLIFDLSSAASDSEVTKSKQRDDSKPAEERTEL